ncbi:MAG: hypothetical protein WD929_08290 [Steroidobacteraceae bacterium]
MKRVTGIGGIFFKARDPAALCAWSQQQLGIDWVMDPEGNRVELWEPPAGQ